MRYFPEVVIGLASGLVIALGGVVGMVVANNFYSAFVVVGLLIATNSYAHYKGDREQFLFGCALPGIVVSTSPFQIASLSDLAIGDRASYETIKIVSKPNLEKAKGLRLATGDRIPVVAMYSGRLSSAKWDDFFPEPALFATDDDVDLARLSASIPEERWLALNEGLFSIPRPFTDGLYPLPSSGLRSNHQQLD